MSSNGVKNKIEMTRKILIVEDDENISSLIRYTLDEAGFRTEQVFTGADAIASVAADPNAVMLLDYILPDMTGKEVVQKLVRRDSLVPFIILTGQGDEKTAIEMMKLGARDYLVKELDAVYMLPQVLFKVFQELITEKKLAKAEAGLRDSEKKWRMLFENLPGGSFVVSDDYRIMDVNDFLCSVTGYSRNELLGELCDIICPKGPHNCPIFDLGEERIENDETAVKTKDGLLVPIIKSAIKIPIDETQAILENFQDITEYKRTEKALVESEERFRAVVESTKDAVISIDRDGSVMLFNPGAEEIFGWKQEEMIGQSFERLIEKEHWKRRQDYISGYFAAGEPQEALGEAVELLALRRDGAAFPVELTLSAGRRGSGKFVLAVIKDITERKRIEEQLRQSEKMQAIGQLAGGVAHDFNNQLLGIMGFADMLKYCLQDEYLGQYADEVVKGTKRCAELTAQLLAFARKGKFQIAPVNMHKVIDEVVSLLGHYIDKRIKIIKIQGAANATVMGDSSQLQNALLNLGINARDAMPDGGNLTFITEAVDLDEEYCRKQQFNIDPGRFLCISVRDTGIGMDKETQKRIFEPFFTTKRQGAGTGMGLAAVYGTVENHKGAVNVYSEPGKGATFRIYLPPDESRKRHKTTGALVIPVKGTGRILVVDDEEIVRSVAVTMLERLGYDVITCENGSEAVERYRDSWREIDLVILDMVMPELGGRDTFIAMREINPDIKAILSSGFSIDGEAQKIIDEGVLCFLAKPFLLAELSRTISFALCDPPDNS